VVAQIGVNIQNNMGKRLKLVGMMVWLLRKCVKCGKYTLNQESCPICGGNLRIPHPAKFSPEDRYAKYRRAMRGLGQNENNGH
jgi:H/ACA ribonucleoprotein complex subunit 3